MRQPKDDDQEAVKDALRHMVDDELPKHVMLTKTQHEKLMALLEFATMVSSVKKFGVPAFNLAVTAAGIWLAAKQFFGSKS